MIIVLRDGRVAESGTHSQLLGKGDLYAELWNGMFIVKLVDARILIPFSSRNCSRG